VALVRLGKIVRAVGLKGLLGVAGSDGALAELGKVALRRGDEPEPPLRDVLEARPQGRVWVMMVEGVSGRTEAESWVGAEVLARREDLPEPGEARHYWADLEGLPVVTTAGAAIGKVTELFVTGGVDVLVVTTEDGGEKLVPLAPYVEVDMAGRRVVVDPPEGLLDD
jgi:16S rRNA processing protein RimM